MRSARRASLAAALTSSALLASAASCGAPPIEDDLGGSLGLPDRGSIEPKAEGGTTTRDASTPIVEAGASAADAADATVVTQTQLCSESDLFLCFGFEGAVTDGSPNLLKPTVSGVSFVPGKLGQAASFGLASAMRFDPSPAFEVPAATVEAWVKLASDPTGDGVIFDADNRFSLTILQDGRARCQPSGATSVGKLMVGQWAHVACVFDGASGRVYLDGVEQNAGPGAYGASPGSSAALGGNAPSGEPFVGAIDSFRAFRVARSAAQIAAAAGK